MKSALTAALVTGGPPVAVPALSGSKTLLDPVAFPCLECAEGIDTPLTSAEALADGVQAIDLQKVVIVGSAPTNVLAANGVALVSIAVRCACNTESR